MSKRTRRTFIQASRAVSPEEKAAFHQVTGAGSSHVKRQFFEVTDREEDEIIDRLRDMLEQQLEKH
jgi:phage gpG-like protein